MEIIIENTLCDRKDIFLSRETVGLSDHRAINYFSDVAESFMVDYTLDPNQAQFTIFYILHDVGIGATSLTASTVNVTACEGL